MSKKCEHKNRKNLESVNAGSHNMVLQRCLDCNLVRYVTTGPGFRSEGNWHKERKR